MFKFTKDLIGGCVTLVAWTTAICVGCEIGARVVGKIEKKKEQKETPENDEIQ